jgi:hypothetical protein
MRICVTISIFLGTRTSFLHKENSGIFYFNNLLKGKFILIFTTIIGIIAPFIWTIIWLIYWQLSTGPDSLVRIDIVLFQIINFIYFTLNSLFIIISFIFTLLFLILTWIEINKSFKRAREMLIEKSSKELNFQTKITLSLSLFLFPSFLVDFWIIILYFLTSISHWVDVKVALKVFGFPYSIFFPLQLFFISFVFIFGKFIVKYNILKILKLK